MSIVSIILIFLVHHLINFFKSTLTVPKIKDLVNTPTQKYENMFHVISKSGTSAHDISNDNSQEYTINDLLPKPKPENDMKNELKNFLKKINTHNNIPMSSTSIDALDSMMSNSYSEYK